MIAQEKYHDGILQSKRAYAIMPIGKMTELLIEHGETPGSCRYRGFLCLFGWAAQTQGRLSANRPRPAFCRCSR